MYREKKPELAPAYDLLSTAIYPDLSDKMAMKMGGKYKADEVFLRHWYKIVPQTQNARNNIEKKLKTLAQRILIQALELKEQLKQENLNSTVMDDICRLIKIRSNRILEQIK